MMLTNRRSIKIKSFEIGNWILEIGLLTFTPPLMGGDKGEGGRISPSPRSSPTRGEDGFCRSNAWFH